jgi:organic radical activating enzyme
MWKFFRNQFKKKLGDTLCLAKWTQTNIYLDKGLTHSCHHPAPHNISLDAIEKNPAALNETAYKIQQRQLMLDGKRPSECDYCWRIEDNNDISDRVTKSFSSWSRPFLKDIVKNGAEHVKLKYLEVSFDNTCNLKCSYCGPGFSSKWVEELNQYGNWPEHNSKINTIPNRDNNPYIDAFWKWWPEIYPSLHTFRITGGEPLLSKNTYKILEELKKGSNKKLTLSINTNLSVPDQIIDKFIEELKDVKVKKIIIHTSCDAHGSAAEYARHGLNYQKWLENCKRILKDIPNVKLDIMVTYNIFSVTTFDKLLYDITTLSKSRNKVTTSISYLRHPEQLTVWVLPSTFDFYIIKQIEFMKKNKFRKTDINQLERILPLLYQEYNRENLQQQFVRFVKEHDRRRSTNFVKSVPLLKLFYDSIAF